MKGSYIISIVIGIICFCILFLGLDLNIIFCGIIAIVMYFACTMLLSKENVSEIQSNPEMLEYQKIYQQSKATINKIKNLEDEISNINLKNNIRSICNTSNKILTSLKDNPKKINQVRKFTEYYLPFTLNILNQYNTIEDQQLTSKESAEFMKKVETMLERVKDACEIQLNNMYEKDLINNNADIKVFETMLKTDGLVDDNMNIIKVKEEGE